MCMYFAPLLVDADQDNENIIDPGEFMKMCFAVLGDGRTLPGDEEEMHISRDNGPANDADPTIDRETIKKMCHCSDAQQDALKEYELDEVKKLEIKQPETGAYCFCRSLARTTRVVVGPSSLFETPETNPEDPEWLKKPTGDNFPMCKCKKSPCLIRRVCQVDELGNPTGSVEGDFKGFFDADNFGGGTYNPGEKQSDGSIRYDSLPIQFVGRNVPYTKFEMNRLEACTQNKRSNACTSDRPKPSVVPESENTGNPGHYSLRFMPSADYEIGGAQRTAKHKLISQLFCEPRLLQGDLTDINDIEFFKTLWANEDGNIEYLPEFISNSHVRNNDREYTTENMIDTEPQPGCTIKFKFRPGNGGDGLDNLKNVPFFGARFANVAIDDIVVTNENPGNLIEVYVPTIWFATTLDASRVEIVANCLEYTYRAIGPGDENLDLFEERCLGITNPLPHDVTLVAPSKDVAEATAIGRCYAADGTGSNVAYQGKPVENTPRFSFPDVCPQFRGIFQIKKGTSDTRALNEYCSSDLGESTSGLDAAGCSGGLSTIQSSSGTCIKHYSPIPIAPGQSQIPITLVSNTLGNQGTISAMDDIDTPENACLQSTAGTPYILVKKATKPIRLTSSTDSQQQQTIDMAATFYTIPFDVTVETEFLETVMVENADVYTCLPTVRGFAVAGNAVDVFFGQCGTFTVELGTGFPTEGAFGIQRMVAVADFFAESPRGFDADSGFYCGEEEDGIDLRSCSEKLLPSEIQIQCKTDEVAVLEMVPASCRHTHSSPYARSVFESDLPTLDIASPGACDLSEGISFCGNKDQSEAPVILNGEIFSASLVETPGVFLIPSQLSNHKTSSQERSFSDCHKKCHETLCTALVWTPPDVPENKGTCLRYTNVNVRAIQTPLDNKRIPEPLFLNQTTSDMAGNNPFLVVCPLKVPHDIVEADLELTAALCPIGFHRVTSNPEDSTGPPRDICVKTQCPENYFSVKPDETKIPEPSYRCPSPIETYTSTEPIIVADKISVETDDGGTFVIDDFKPKIIKRNSKIKTTFVLPQVTPSTTDVSDTTATLASVRIELPELFTVSSECRCQADANNLRFGIKCDEKTHDELATTIDDNKRYAVKTQVHVVLTNENDNTVQFQHSENYIYTAGSTSYFIEKEGLEILIPKSLESLTASVEVTVDGVIDTEYTLPDLEDAGGANNGDNDVPMPFQKPVFSPNTEPVDTFDILYMPTPKKADSTIFYRESILKNLFRQEANAYAADKPYTYACPITAIPGEDGTAPLPFTANQCTTEVEITAAGSGYTVGTGLLTTGGNGNGLTVSITKVGDDGSVVEVEVDASGTGYSVDEKVTIVAPNDEAVASELTLKVVETCIRVRNPEIVLTVCKHVDPVPHNCGGVTVCTASEYEHTAPTGTSDRKCLAITTCESSEYEHTAPTATSDRGCARRPECNLDLTYYGSNPDDPAYDICVPKTGCQHVGSSTDANTPDAAVNHVVDSDASTRDVQCVEITTCRTNPEEGEDQEYISKAHTAVSDRECTTVIESCVENENYETAAPGESNDRVCTPVSVCLEGETEAKDGQPTPSKDRVCVPVGVLEEEEKEKEATEPVFDAMLGWTLGGVGVGGLVVALLNAGLLW